MDGGKTETVEKDRETRAEQRMLMELYEDFKSVINRKGNTTVINKAGETA